MRPKLLTTVLSVVLAAAPLAVADHPGPAPTVPLLACDAGVCEHLIYAGDCPAFEQPVCDLDALADHHVDCLVEVILASCPPLLQLCPSSDGCFVATLDPVIDGGDVFRKGLVAGKQATFRVDGTPWAAGPGVPGIALPGPWWCLYPPGGASIGPLGADATFHVTPSSDGTWSIGVFPDASAGCPPIAPPPGASGTAFQPRGGPSTESSHIVCYPTCQAAQPGSFGVVAKQAG